MTPMFPPGGNIGVKKHTMTPYSAARFSLLYLFCFGLGIAYMGAIIPGAVFMIFASFIAFVINYHDHA